MFYQCILPLTIFFRHREKSPQQLARRPQPLEDDDCTLEVASSVKKRQKVEICWAGKLVWNTRWVAKCKAWRQRFASAPAIVLEQNLHRQNRSLQRRGRLFVPHRQQADQKILQADDVQMECVRHQGEHLGRGSQADGLQNQGARRPLPGGSMGLVQRVLHHGSSGWSSPTTFQNVYLKDVLVPTATRVLSTAGSSSTMVRRWWGHNPEGLLYRIGKSFLNSYLCHLCMGGISMASFPVFTRGGKLNC